MAAVPLPCVWLTGACFDKGVVKLRRIFDFHTHVYPDKIAAKAVDFLNNYYHADCQGTGTIEDLTASAKEAGVTHLLIHAVATKPSQVENVNSFIAGHVGGTVYGFGSIHPGYPHIADEMERIRSLGLRGLKLHPDFQHFFADSPKMDPIYDAAQGVMPVLFHAGDEQSDFSTPERIRNVVRRFPKLVVVAAHLGGYSCWQHACGVLSDERILVDCSSSLPFIPQETAVRIIRTYGANRVLFGTDYPLTRHKEELARFLALPLTAAEQDAILYGNAARLLGLEG